MLNVCLLNKFIYNPCLMLRNVCLVNKFISLYNVCLICFFQVNQLTATKPEVHKVISVHRATSIALTIDLN